MLKQNIKYLMLAAVGKGGSTLYPTWEQINHGHDDSEDEPIDDSELIMVIGGDISDDPIMKGTVLSLSYVYMTTAYVRYLL